MSNEKYCSINSFIFLIITIKITKNLFMLFFINYNLETFLYIHKTTAIFNYYFMHQLYYLLFIGIKMLNAVDK